MAAEDRRSAENRGLGFAGNDSELVADVIDDLIHQLLPVLLVEQVGASDGPGQARAEPLRRALEQARLARRVLGADPNRPPPEELSVAIATFQLRASGLGLPLVTRVDADAHGLALTIKTLLARTVGAVTEGWFVEGPVTEGSSKWRPGSEVTLVLGAGPVVVDLEITGPGIAEALTESSAWSSLRERWRGLGGALAVDEGRLPVGHRIGGWLPR